MVDIKLLGVIVVYVVCVILLLVNVLIIIIICYKKNYEKYILSKGRVYLIYVILKIINKV